jgi:BirA family biotin operon repressor/biotin-[acetyl-CoA-carboxylase] ligase
MEKFYLITDHGRLSGTPASYLVKRIREGLVRFEAEGLAAFAEHFARLDVLHGRPLQLSGADNRSGIGAGIDNDGALLVQTDNKTIRVISGDVSVRALPA